MALIGSIDVQYSNIPYASSKTALCNRETCCHGRHPLPRAMRRKLDTMWPLRKITEALTCSIDVQYSTTHHTTALRLPSATRESSLWPARASVALRDTPSRLIHIACSVSVPLLHSIPLPAGPGSTQARLLDGVPGSNSNAFTALLTSTRIL